jgi:hypothetical protein
LENKKPEYDVRRARSVLNAKQTQNVATPTLDYAPHGNKIPICLEQLTSKHTSDGCTKKPLSDNELLELYHAVNIRVRIAREAAMPDPRLQHLVVLCNLRDAISIGEYQLYLERARAYTSSRPIRSGTLTQVESNHNVESAISDVHSVAPMQCDTSVQFQLKNIHLNF